MDNAAYLIGIQIIVNLTLLVKLSAFGDSFLECIFSATVVFYLVLTVTSIMLTAIRFIVNEGPIISFCGKAFSRLMLVKPTF